MHLERKEKTHHAAQQAQHVGGRGGGERLKRIGPELAAGAGGGRLLGQQRAAEEACDEERELGHHEEQQVEEGGEEGANRPQEEGERAHRVGEWADGR